MIYLRKVLTYLPASQIIGLSLFKWYMPEQKLLIFISFSVFNLMLCIGLFFYSQFKYRVKVRSPGEIILSLMSMRKISGVALIIAMMMSFTWLIDYAREFPDWDKVPFLSLGGAVYSFSLIMLIAGIVIFFEKEKLSKIKYSHPTKPVKTKGLVLTLSRFSPAFDLQTFKNLVEKISFTGKEFLESLDQVHKLKTRNQLHRMRQIFSAKNKDENYIQFFSLLEKSPLYPLLIAISYHLPRLKRIWLLISDEAKVSTYPVFEKLFKKAIPDWKKINIIPERLEHPEDIKNVSLIVNSIYYNLPEERELGEHEITADITGGPASVTAGIVLACVRSKRRVEYLSQKDYKLMAIDVNVASIPHLFDELVEQIDIIRAREFTESASKKKSKKRIK